MPNIIGSFGITGAKEYKRAEATGAFTKVTFGTVNNALYGSGSGAGFNFDATLSSTVYNSDISTVQTSSNQNLIIIKF